MATPSLSAQNYFSTTLATTVTATDTVFYLNSLPTASEGYLELDEGTSNKEIIYYTSKGANFVTCPSVAAGRAIGGTTAVGHTSGATVKQKLNAEYWAALQDASALTGLHTYFNESFYDYTLSGGVWTGDAYASTRNASMTAWTGYINGRRYTQSAVTARSFTASKDTYVDILANSDGTSTLVYTEVVNNAASPALAANSIRIAIVVTGATTIAAAGSINQGQLDRVLPIASSVAYTLTDSLGNLIYNTTPTPVVIGYRQLTADFTGSATTDTAVTGLSVPAILPTGRHAQITWYIPAMSTTAASNIQPTIWDGTVGSGTLITRGVAPGGSVVTIVRLSGDVYGAGTTKTYNAGYKSGGAGTATVAATTATYGVAGSYMEVRLV